MVSWLPFYIIPRSIWDHCPISSGISNTILLNVCGGCQETGAFWTSALWDIVKYWKRCQISTSAQFSCYGVEFRFNQWTFIALTYLIVISWVFEKEMWKWQWFKSAFQNIWPCFKCDLANSFSGKRSSLNKRFLYLLCYMSCKLQYICNGWTDLTKISQCEEKTLEITNLESEWMPETPQPRYPFELASSSTCTSL